MKLLIRGALLEGVARDILLDDGRISSITTDYKGPADRLVDGSGKVALPALINGHTHAAMTLFRGFADDMPLKQWLQDKIWPIEAKLTPEEIYWGSKLACLEMIRNGITVFNDMYWFWEATAQAVVDMGIRGLISAVFIDGFDAKKSDEQIEENLRLFGLAEKYAPSVTFTFGPHALYTVSEKSLSWMREFSESRDILIHMHLSETDEEIAFAEHRYGCRPTGLLERLGLLSPRFVGCHGCALSPEDVKVLKQYGASLVHVPVSNLKLAVGRAFPYTAVADEHLPFCLGTDGCASNNRLDIFETMKFASLLAKFHSNDPTMMPARHAFEAATETAASIFRLGEWVIREGAAPDIMLLSLDSPEFTPGYNLHSDLVYASHGSAVDTVICMGKVVMENRRVAGEEKIIKEARRAAWRLVGR
jgi:5-methylthioadenosine/S-adenosylhomocysteine deaminase